MIAIVQGCIVNGEQRKTGQVVETSPDIEKMLVAIGRAVFAPGKQRDMDAVSDVQPAEKPKRRRRGK
jgi:hypothetical protein